VGGSVLTNRSGLSTTFRRSIRANRRSDEWLRKRALANEQSGALRTYVITADGRVVGFIHAGFSESPLDLLTMMISICEA
jgi:hypothetical protein